MLKEPVPYHALEFDADGMAVTALYRWQDYLVKGALSPEARAEYELDPVAGKLMIPYSAFWPIRERIGSAIAADNESATHPSWHIRFFSIIRKLAYIDHVTGVGENNPVESREAIESEIKEGLDLFATLEHFYLLRKGLAAETSPIYSFLDQDFVTNYFDPVFQSWCGISELIRKHMYLDLFRRSAFMRPLA
jgi:hypothetical protein